MEEKKERTWQRRKGRKGFTLVELIVVMAVIGILVLLAAPRFIGHTKEATFTKHINNAKVLEDASERYYIDHGQWPRGADEDKYTAEEVATYAEKIYDITGEEIALEYGNYWDIDYSALGTYAKLPDEDERANYVLRNPVGKIFYLEGLTEKGQTRLPEYVREESEKEEEESGAADERDYSEPVVFHGLGPEAFDGDITTYATGVGTVTWDGELANREISITGMGSNNGSIYYYLNVAFQDEAGNTLKSITNNADYSRVASNTVNTVKLIVPEGAKKMVFTTLNPSYNYKMKIYDIRGTN